MWILKIFFLLISMTFIGCDDPITIETSLGKIIGTRNAVNGKQIDVFLGVPYAEKPVRFQKPQPPTKFPNPITANDMPPSCPQPQLDIFKKSGVDFEPLSEDCLFLNIWSPEDKHELKPVMVWIHGGGFKSGAIKFPFYNGILLSSIGDVVVVTVNYRVGALGFLATGEAEEPGNIGLYDQNLALQWVQSHIANFGGDPKRVTLFGESAGAISVSMHMVSPKSNALFQKAIIQSGTYNMPLFNQDLDENMIIGDLLAAKVGCKLSNESLKTDAKNILECLRKKDFREINLAEEQLYDELLISVLPIIGDEFLPLETLKQFKGPPIDTLMGFNRDEGNFILFFIFSNVNFVDSEKMLPKSKSMHLIKKFIEDGFKFINIDHVIEEYFKGIAEDDVDGARSALSKILGDVLFVCPSLFFADKRATNMDTGKLFLYYFTHKTTLPSPLPQWDGSTHFDEVPFMFGIPLTPIFPFTEEEQIFSMSMINQWTSFAKKSAPQDVSSWPQYTPNTGQAHELNPNTRGSVDVRDFERCYKDWKPHFDAMYTKKKSPEACQKDCEGACFRKEL